MYRNDELNWLFTKRFRTFYLFAENSQNLLKLSVIPILLTLMYIVALNILANNQLNSSLRQMIDSFITFANFFKPYVFSCPMSIPESRVVHTQNIFLYHVIILYSTIKYLPCQMAQSEFPLQSQTELIWQLQKIFQI